MSTKLFSLRSKLVNYFIYSVLFALPFSPLITQEDFCGFIPEFNEQSSINENMIQELMVDDPEGIMNGGIYTIPIVFM